MTIEEKKQLNSEKSSYLLLGCFVTQDLAISASFFAFNHCQSYILLNHKRLQRVHLSQAAKILDLGFYNISSKRKSFH